MAVKRVSEDQVSVGAPKISVIIVSHNGLPYLIEAIESVRAQSTKDYELILIDDGSTDDSASIVEKRFPEVRLFKQKRWGISRARNLAHRKARGEFIAYLDADDLWEASKLEKQLRVFEETPRLDLVYCHVEEFLDPVGGSGERISAGIKKGYIPSALLGRRESIIRTGDYDEDLMLGMFIDWYIRAEKMGLETHMMDEVLVWRRIHGENNSIKNRLMYSEYLHVLKNTLVERRKSDQS